LDQFERIGDVIVTMEQFTGDNGLLTPALELAKGRIEEKYGEELSRLV
jgi:long-subunit acyl-CoA synthetase (AMP-forming)